MPKITFYIMNDTLYAFFDCVLLQRTILVKKDKMKISLLHIKIYFISVLYFLTSFC